MEMCVREYISVQVKYNFELEDCLEAQGSKILTRGKSHARLKGYLVI